MYTVAIGDEAIRIYCGTVLDVIRVPIANFQKSSFLFLKFAVIFFAVVAATAHIAITCEHYHTGSCELLVM